MAAHRSKPFAGTNSKNCHLTCLYYNFVLFTTFHHRDNDEHRPCPSVVIS